MHVNRGPAEPVNADLQQFYEKLFGCLRHSEAKEGDWCLLECTPAWDGNWTWDCFICFAWRGPGRTSLIVTVNYAPNQSQCRVHMPFDDLKGRQIRLRDLMGPAGYNRAGDEISTRGLYLDEPAWAYHVFEMTVAD